jgi:hypothetical protein
MRSTLRYCARFTRIATGCYGTVGATLAAVRAARVPYLLVAGDDPEPGYREWLTEMLRQASVTVWPGSGAPNLALGPGRLDSAVVPAGMAPPADTARIPASAGPADPQSSSGSVS